MSAQCLRIRINFNRSYQKWKMANIIERTLFNRVHIFSVFFFFSFSYYFEVVMYTQLHLQIIPDTYEDNEKENMIFKRIISTQGRFTHVDIVYVMKNGKRNGY